MSLDESICNIPINQTKKNEKKRNIYERDNKATRLET
jgi:hypothetical protein